VSAPRKAPGGLDRVLYVRADDALLTALDGLRKAGESRADAVRRLVLQRSAAVERRALAHQEELGDIAQNPFV